MEQLPPRDEELKPHTNAELASLKEDFDTQLSDRERHRLGLLLTEFVHVRGLLFQARQRLGCDDPSRRADDQSLDMFCSALDGALQGFAEPPDETLNL